MIICTWWQFSSFAKIELDSILLSNKYTPKYAISFQYFNPTLADIVFDLDFGFKFKSKSEKFFYKFNFLYSKADASNFQLFHFSPTVRLTMKRNPWIHLEFSLGLSYCHRKFYRFGIFEVQAHGLGLNSDLGLYFDLGKRIVCGPHISLTPAYTYNVIQDYISTDNTYFNGLTFIGQSIIDFNVIFQFPKIK